MARERRDGRLSNAAERAKDAVADALKGAGTVVREGVGRVADAARDVGDRAIDVLERLRSRGRITGVHVVGSPAAAAAAREYGVSDRPLLAEGARVSVAWRREGSLARAAIFHDADLPRRPERLQPTLRMATRLAEQLVDEEGVRERARAWARDAGVDPRDLDDDPSDGPDDEGSVGPDHGIEGIADDEAVFARMRPLLPSEVELARSVYGDSLDTDRIYMGATNGIGGAPYTPSWPFLRDLRAPRPIGPGMWISVLCMGKRLYRDGVPDAPVALPSGAPPPDARAKDEARHVFIHELCHAWQSQHHFDPSQYMWNAIGSQAKGAFLGLAYFYRRGRRISSYGAEQLASIVQNAFRRMPNLDVFHATVLAHVRRVRPHAIDPALVAGLRRARITLPVADFDAPPPILPRDESLLRD